MQTKYSIFIRRRWVFRFRRKVRKVSVFNCFSTVFGSSKNRTDMKISDQKSYLSKEHTLGFRRLPFDLQKLSQTEDTSHRASRFFRIFTQNVALSSHGACSEERISLTVTHLKGHRCPSRIMLVLCDTTRYTCKFGPTMFFDDFVVLAPDHIDRRNIFYLPSERLKSKISEKIEFLLVFAWLHLPNVERFPRRSGCRHLAISCSITSTP